jgi:hypothetical protein
MHFYKWYKYPGIYKSIASKLFNYKQTLQCLDIEQLRLIDWLLSVLRPAQEYFTYMETSNNYDKILQSVHVLLLHF